MIVEEELPLDNIGNYFTGSNDCAGQSSCTIQVNDNSGKYIFVKAQCKNTDITIDLDITEIEITKTYIAFGVAVFDFIAIGIFAIALGW